MAAPARVDGAKTYGRKNAWFVPDIADINSPLLTELTAAGAVELETYLYREATTDPTLSQDGVTAPPRVSDTQQFQSRGDANWQGGTLAYMVDPQAAAGSEGKKISEALPEGTTGFYVRRLSVPYGTTPAAGQFVSIWPIETGAPNEIEQGDGAAAEVAYSQGYFVTGPPALTVALA